VLIVFMFGTITGDLRDSILCKRKILHQHIQTLILLIQELPHPPKQRVRERRERHHYKKNTVVVAYYSDVAISLISKSWNSNLFFINNIILLFFIIQYHHINNHALIKLDNPRDSIEQCVQKLHLDAETDVMKYVSWNGVSVS